jgi:FkbM family methyltransferase
MAMRFRPKRATKRVARALLDPVNAKSLLFTAQCIRGWAKAKFGHSSVSHEATLDLRRLRLCVDTSRAELLSYWEVWHERCYEAFPQFRVDHPGCVVDVGANIGAFSLYQSLIRGAGKIVAFEPSPAVFPRLVRNLAINRVLCTTAINSAAGCEQKILCFSEGRMSINGKVSEEGPIAVRCTTLDAELSNIQKIEILKVDTEGYELEVLAGASQTLKKTERIVLELHFTDERAQLDSVLHPLGFEFIGQRDDLVFYVSSDLLGKYKYS